MAFDLSSPVAQLAFEMALRNQQVPSTSRDAEARAFVSKALQVGNDQLAPFDDIYRQYMDPVEAQRRAQAQAFNEYLVGLPELLAASQKEFAEANARGRGGGGGGGTTRIMNPSGVSRSPLDILNSILGRVAPQRTAYRAPTTTASKKRTTTAGAVRSVPTGSRLIRRM